MKNGFYPYTGPAGKDNPRRPYPKWYYPDADSISSTARSMQEYFRAIDEACRSIYSARLKTSAQNLWYLGAKAGEGLLPANADAEQEAMLLTGLKSKNASLSALPYPELLLMLHRSGKQTRLLEWSGSAVTALKAALKKDTSDAVVWCLNPLCLNLALCGGEGQTPSAVMEMADKTSAEFFEGTGKAASHPFAAAGSFKKTKGGNFVVFPLGGDVTALEKLGDSAAYLAKITIPASSFRFLGQQLLRYGL